jgi:hypothetical protein
MVLALYCAILRGAPKAFSADRYQSAYTKRNK